MEWQNAFPEMLDAAALAALNDADALQAYIDGVNVAGDERATAIAADESLATDELLDECEAYKASRADAEARLEAVKAANAAKAARISGLAFPKPGAPAPAPAPAPTLEIETPQVEVVSTWKPTMALACSAIGKNAGDVITIEEQGRALIERAKQLSGSGTREKFTVAKLSTHIDPSMQLPEDPYEAMRFMVNDHYDDEAIVAGFSALPTNEYGFCGGSSSARPVLNSLRRYIAPRGRVKKVITPLFSDVGTDDGEIDTTGIGQWTNADDDAEPLVPKTCSILTCVDDETFELWSTYKCVTIKNFLKLAYPEWVDFSGMMLDAHWARFAETLLLDAMFVRGGGAITTSPIYGAMVSVLTRMDQLLNNFVENERYDDAGLVGWMPRWLIHKLRSDAILRGVRPPSQGDIESAFADVGLSKIVWTMDNPTQYGEYPHQSKSVDLVEYPTDMWALVTKADNLRAMDFGERDIGITTEREYRDTESNTRNDYQVFVETFEGVIDNGCPVWHFRMELCDNGLVAPTDGTARTCPDDSEFPS